jgi:mannosyl-oligosaccharide alpha-1,2-mannosidase
MALWWWWRWWRRLRPRRTTTLLLVASLIASFFYLRAEFDRHLEHSAHEAFHAQLPYGGVGGKGSRAQDVLAVQVTHQGEEGGTGSDAGKGRPKDGAYPTRKPVPHEKGEDEAKTMDAAAFWRALPIHHPVSSLEPLPTGTPLAFPPVQHVFPTETEPGRARRLARRDAVQATFRRCWASYRRLAWGHDELAPLSGTSRDPYGGWGATLVDSLDTLWIMGMREEFEEAVGRAVRISFLPREIARRGEKGKEEADDEGDDKGDEKINVFETNIRYLGGFIAAYELSGDARLLRKAREVGEMLYAALDTHNRLPLPQLDLHLAAAGKAQPVWDDTSALADAGSFSMEFSRLSLLTGDPKWFDAAQRITRAFAAQQNSSRLPGLWPALLSVHRDRLDRDPNFGLGGGADSMYEYLLKTHLLLGGLVPEYRRMYEVAMEAAVKHLLFRPRLPNNGKGKGRGKGRGRGRGTSGADPDVDVNVDVDVLVAGTVLAMPDADGKIQLTRTPVLEHLACFAGGMFALGSKALSLASHLPIARQLTQGCVWAYGASPAGIMPERATVLACEAEAGDDDNDDDDDERCGWRPDLWALDILERNGFEARGNPRADLQVAQKLARKQRLPAGFTSVLDASYLLRPEAVESLFVLHRATGDGALAEAAWAMFEAVEARTRTALGSAALKDVTADDDGREGRAGPQQRDSMESFWMGETLKYFYLVFSEPELVSLDEWVFNTEAHPFRRLLGPSYSKGLR